MFKEHVKLFLHNFLF